jgi:hypothetical protein
LACQLEPSRDAIEIVKARKLPLVIMRSSLLPRREVFRKLRQKFDVSESLAERVESVNQAIFSWL